MLIASDDKPRRSTHDLRRLAPYRRVDEALALRRSRSTYVRCVKPTLDVVIAIVTLIVFALPMVLISLTVLARLGRPILFRQQRVGRDGRSFEVLKFRTMKPCRRRALVAVEVDRRRTHKSEADPRLGRVGRLLRALSLDELPQLFNVLRGEMSIVGPRPELSSIVERYPPEVHLRHLVKPGLTGLWQVEARGSGLMHEHPEWDLRYAESVSLLTDLRVLARTPLAILGPRRGT